MKETISAFAKGKINIEELTPAINPGQILEFIEPDSTMQGSFMVDFGSGKRIKACVFSTNRRMTLNKEQFHSEKIELIYTFNGIGMNEGDVIQGDVILLCETGEFRVPFTITAQQNTIVTGQGRLRNLEVFAALAGSDRAEAYKAFCKHRFLNTLKNEDSRFTTLYKGLTRDGFTEEAMTEFLTAIRNTDYDYDTDSGKSTYSSRRRGQISNQDRNIEKDRIACLYELFLDFRCMKTSTKAWLIKTRALLSEQMGMKNDSGFYSLYYVHTLVIEGKADEAKLKLDEVMEHMTGISKNPSLYAYYLYLCALIDGTETLISLNCKRVWDIYKKNNKNPFVLWILFMMDKDLLNDVNRRCEMAEALYERGTVSPVILMEIALLFRRNHALCSELSSFNIQVLIFAAKNHILTPELYSVIYKMAMRSNVFSTRVYLLLVQCYEELKDKESLQTICYYLIRNDRSDNKYFKWFELGVEQELRIARLYDYYLYSVKEDMEKALPENVLQYFKFNMEIEYNKKSFLFANLYRFRDEIGQLYEEYREDMELFINLQLELGRVNRHLAYLYSELVDESMVNGRNARQIADLVFTYHAKDLPSWANTIVVTDAMFVGEREYPIVNGEADVQLYSDSSCILLKDGERKRFVKSAGLWEKWFKKEEILEICKKYCPNHPGLVLKRCKQLVSGRDTDWEETTAGILNNQELTFYAKDQILHSLLDYFYNHEDIGNLKKLLKVREDFPQYIKTGKNHLSIFLQTGHFDEAYEYALKNGCEHIPAAKLVAMCDYAIEKNEGEYIEDLYALTGEIFKRGKYSEAMLDYLITYVKGDTGFLIALLKAGKAFSMNVAVLEEKILVQLMFSKQLPESVYEIYKDYDLHGGKTIIKNAFLSFMSHEAIKNNRVIRPELAEWINKRLENSYQITDICKIMWLKAYSEGFFADDTIATGYMEEFEQEDRFFEFFNSLPKKLRDKYFFTNKIIIECKAEANADVNCYYSINNADTFTRKHMAEMYDGIYVTTLPIFYSDRLRYYVSYEKDDYSCILESRIISRTEEKEEGFSRYEHLNSILAAQSYEEKDEKILEFLKEDYVTGKLFNKF